MPHVIAFAARHHGQIVAMALWVRSGSVVYGFLEGTSLEGYKTQAMHGIIATATDYFADCRIMHLGGAAGLEAGDAGGLIDFKRGFANREVTAYFCGCCLDPGRYAVLTKDLPATSFFPAYRQP